MDKNLIRNVIPGEEIASLKSGFMSGWGTYTDNESIYSSVAGVVQTITKLVTVQPKNSCYKPELGDVVIGRIISIDKKSWKVDINAGKDGNLQLTAINLPQGEQRRRNEEDKLNMRSFFEEGDLLSGEIQNVNEGSIAIQTRNLKYGKVTF